jgi:hypothetical protein
MPGETDRGEPLTERSVLRHICLPIAFYTAILLTAPLAANSAPAQTPGAGGRNEIFVGSALEDYLRVLQLAGKTQSTYPWSIRSFSPREIDLLAAVDSSHPWAQRYELGIVDAAQRRRAGLIAPRLEMLYNSAFPHGTNNGPIWAGRGLTSAVQLGVSARFGPLSLTLAPVFFRAENEPFPLAEVSEEASPFASPFRTDMIDLPQRFGDGPYSRLDAGQSTLRLDLPWVATGISTANQHWGPATEHPFVLGNNAPGFLHAFLGTAQPLNAWLGHVHGRVVWGRLEQSEFFDYPGTAPRRFMTGVVGVFMPRGVPGLELGVSRFFHNSWPSEGLSARDFLQPFESFLKIGLPDRGIADPSVPDDLRLSAPDNQLASAFFRWVLPRSGFEIYGEYGREDHNFDLRDFLIEPDHHSSYMIGLGKVWERSADRLVRLKAEVINTQVSHVVELRSQAPLYIHSEARQGHTHRGQILGSAAGFGGGGAILALQSYSPSGGWEVEVTRALRADATFRNPEDIRDPLRGLDVVHGLGVGRSMFLGRTDIAGAIVASQNMHRDFGDDRLNLGLQLRIRAGW